MTSSRPPVFGVEVDRETRCAHWRSPLDVIAIKLRCCGAYYACRDCNDALADHAAQVWPRAEWDQPAVLCGGCGDQLSVQGYMDCENRCPGCGAPFNPGCRLHYPLYFEA